MTIDFTLILQIILLAFIFYLMYAHIEFGFRKRVLRTSLIYKLNHLSQYLDYKIVLSQKDTESYHRYEIWRFFERIKYDIPCNLLTD